MDDVLALAEPVRRAIAELPSDLAEPVYGGCLRYLRLANGPRLVNWKRH